VSEQLAPMTRRGVLGAAAVAGLALAGCGGASSTNGGGNATGTVAVPPPSQRKRGGTFRLGDSQMSATTSLDVQSASTSFVVARTMTNTLVERDHQFVQHLSLAEEFSPVASDFSVWNIRVRDGVEFHDGRTLSADDVIYTIRRNIDPKAPGFTSGFMSDIKSMRKMDDRTVRITLNHPDSQFAQGFCQIPSGILPVGFDPKRPVGTGPFKLVSFTPGQRFVAERNPNYWARTGGPYLDRLELIGFADQNARLNALLTGQVDGADRLLFSQVKSVRSRSNIDVVVSDTGSFEMIELKSGKGQPFESADARMAFKLMVDRQQMVNVVYSGYGALGNDTGTWHEFDASYPSDLAQRAQDLDKAKALAKSSGLAGRTIPMRVGELVPGMLAAADVLVEQAKAIGLNIKVDKLADLGQFYSSKDYYNSPLQIDYDFTQTMYMNLKYVYLPTGPYNNTSYDNAQVNSLTKQALRSTGDQYDQLMAQISKILYEDGPFCVWGRRSQPDALNRKFVGLQPDAAGTGFNGNKFEEISLA
jgi:peptide/nickel transport system substrate-binding protein